MEFSDRTLPDRYLKTRDEAAFAVLVRRYLDQVHALAELVTGNEELARDVAQTTFIRLAQRAALIPNDLPLSSWLHRVARSLAVDLVRVETRRKKRERNNDPTPHPLATMDPVSASEPDWSALAPVVDELVERLPAADRDVLLLRYYRNESHAAVAARLGLTEGAARKRALRALDKLRVLLGKQGIATSAGALAMLLPAHAAPIAPGMLAGAVLQATQGIAPLAPTFLNSVLLAVTTSQKNALIGALLLLLAATGYTLSPEDHPVESAGAVAGPGAPAGKGFEEKPGRIRTARPVPGTPEERRERLKAIVAMRNKTQRKEELIGYLDALPSGLWAETATTVSEMREGSEEELLLFVLYGWSRADPLAALEFAQGAEKVPSPGSGWGPSMSLELEVLDNWAAADPRAAAARVMAEQGVHQRARLDSVLTGCFRASPEEALEIATGLEDECLKREVMAHLGHMMVKDPEMLSRLMARASPEQKAAIIADVTPYAPEQALTMLKEFPEAGDMEAIYRTLANMNTSYVLRALDQEEPGPRRERIVTSALYSLIRREPVEALKLMDLYPAAASGEARREALDGLAKTDPARALGLIGSLREEDERAFMTGSYLKVWLEKDPVTAGKWLQEHPQPTAVLDRL